MGNSTNSAQATVKAQETVKAKEKAKEKETHDYHHGELPETLMQLALEHIEREGTEKLSLRALAREAGVSPTAPYRHFPAKNCLLAAIATEGFHILMQRNAKARCAELSAKERLIQMSLSYVDFAMESPSRYQLMFGSVLADFSEYEMLHRASGAAYEEVNLLIEEIAADRKDPGFDAQIFAGVIWSFVHGMSSLLISEVTTLDEEAKPRDAIRAVRNDREAAIRMMIENVLA